jgi:hypothetical protein
MYMGESGGQVCKRYHYYEEKVFVKGYMRRMEEVKGSINLLHGGGDGSDSLRT